MPVVHGLTVEPSAVRRPMRGTVDPMISDIRHPTPDGNESVGRPAFLDLPPWMPTARHRSTRRSRRSSPAPHPRGRSWSCSIAWPRPCPRTGSSWPSTASSRPRSTTMDDFRRLPLTDKQNYHRRYPLPELCRGGRLDGCDIVAVSSGSTGQPTVWPRSLTDELGDRPALRAGLPRRLRRARAQHARGGLLPARHLGRRPVHHRVLRHLAAKGYPITVVAPGNNKEEILRVLPELAGHFEQIVLLGYPPFVKDVVDTGLAARLRLVTAPDRSWCWPARCSARSGATWSGAGSAWPTRPGHRVALRHRRRRRARQRDAAVGRRSAASSPGGPELARELFGDARLPTLVQYDPPAASSRSRTAPCCSPATTACR